MQGKEQAEKTLQLLARPGYENELFYGYNTHIG
jgi:hypothetical protein